MSELSHGGVFHELSQKGFSMGFSVGASPVRFFAGFFLCNLLRLFWRSFFPGGFLPAVFGRGLSFYPCAFSPGLFASAPSPALSVSALSPGNFPCTLSQ